MKGPENDKHPLYWERVALGELTGPGGSEEEERLAVIAESNREILSQLPEHEVVREVMRRRRQQSPAATKAILFGSWHWLVPVASATALVGGLVLAIRAVPDGDPTGHVRRDDVTKTHATKTHAAERDVTDQAQDPLGGERSKGSPRLIVQRRTAQGVANLRSGDDAKPNDLLQLSYRAEGHRYGVVVSVDGRGVVTRHLPETGSEAATVKPEGRQFLPTSYQLDDAPDFESFYLVVSTEPFQVDGVLRAIEQRAPSETELELDAKLVQFVFTLRKVEAPK